MKVRVWLREFPDLGDLSRYGIVFVVFVHSSYAPIP